MNATEQMLANQHTGLMFLETSLVLLVLVIVLDVVKLFIYRVEIAMLREVRGLLDVNKEVLNVATQRRDDTKAVLAEVRQATKDSQKDSPPSGVPAYTTEREPGSATKEPNGIRPGSEVGP